MTLAGSLSVLVVALLGAGGVHALEVDASVSSDEARCGWTLSITHLGVGTFDVFPARHLSRRLTFSAKRMREIERLLEREDFAQLDGSLGDLPVHGPSARIRVKTGGREHAVVLHSLPSGLAPVWRSDPGQLGRVFRVCEYLRGLAGVEDVMHCPGVPDEKEHPSRSTTSRMDWSDGSDDDSAAPPKLRVACE